MLSLGALDQGPELAQLIPGPWLFCPPGAARGQRRTIHLGLACDSGTSWDIMSEWGSGSCPPPGGSQAPAWGLH